MDPNTGTNPLAPDDTGAPSPDHGASPNPANPSAMTEQGSATMTYANSAPPPAATEWHAPPPPEGPLGNAETQAQAAALVTERQQWQAMADQLQAGTTAPAMAASPADEIARLTAENAALKAHAAQQQQAAGAPAPETRFSDVSKDHADYAAIEYAAQSGAMTGMADGRFYPSAPVKRQDLARALYAQSHPTPGAT